MGLLMLAATAWAASCPATLPHEYVDDPRSLGRVFLVAKAERFVGVYENDALVPGTCFMIQLGPGGDDGPKLVRGDMRTPEGWYAISHRNPSSRFYRSLGINYPNFDDVMRGVEEGTIDHETGKVLVRSINAGELPRQDTALGGDIFIHGNPSRWMNDWTWGCIAVATSPSMDVLYRLGDPGTSVLILPRL